MKRSLLISLACLGILTIAAPLALAQKPVKPSVSKATTAEPQPYNLSILELTNSETYRYARETYLRGEYAKAAQIFLEMLRVDCGNKIAQYHLRKIAAKDPSLAFLNKKLDQLPCKAYDFSKEDFLPASVYYENDADIVLEQLISYKSRHRLSEKEMLEKIDNYMIMVRDLESTVAALKATAPETATTTLDQATLDRIEEGKRAAGKIEKEITFIKNQMASERLDRQKEIQDMRTGLAEAEVRLNNEPAARPSGTSLELRAPVPEYSENARAIMNAVAQARIELEGKERRLIEKDAALLSLQNRFDDIQRRLKAIQNDLANKNAQIQAIQTNLQDTQRP